MKKFAKITGISLLVVFVLLFTLPFLFKSRILRLVKSEINSSLNAKVEFSDLSLSLFRRFPSLNMRLENISVAGMNAFEGDTLLQAKAIDVSLSLWSVINGDRMDVHGVYLDAPRIRAMINKDGVANWDIAKTGDTSSAASTDTSSSFAMHLQHYAIKDGYVLYDDREGNMRMEIEGMNHEGSGDFTEDVFTLATKTKAATASFTYENIPYLIKAEAGVDADIEVDNKTATYTFRNTDLLVNNLKLVANGFFRLVNDSTYAMDIAFNAPSTDFKDLLSLVPAVYKNDFDKIKTGGIAKFSGFVKGSYSPFAMPAYQVDLDVKNAFFQYPDLPQPIKNIQLTAQLSNPDGISDHAVVDITKGHFELGLEPIDFRLVFKNPETAQYIDASVKGKVNLAELTSFIKLENGTRLSGTLLADAFARGNLASLQGGTGSFRAGGFLDLKNLFYTSKDFPRPIRNGNILLQLENDGAIADATVVNITSGHVEIGEDPLDFTLQLKNPMSSVDFTGTASGKLNLEGVKQFVDLDNGTSLGGFIKANLGFSGSKAAVDRKTYDKIDINGTVQFSQINYTSKEYPGGIKLSSAQLVFSPTNITLNNLQGSFMHTTFTANGALNNLIGYALQDQTLQGTLIMGADKVNLNHWMGTETAATTSDSTAVSTVFQVPAKIDLTVHAKADEVTYDKVTYRQVNGTLLLKDEMVKLHDVQTEAIGGSIAFNGSYSTKENKKQPAVAMSYQIKEVDVQKAFLAFNTVQKLMPLGKFLTGKLSSQMNVTGFLGGDMMPDVKSLTGNGSMILLEGVLGKFPPLEKLATTLQINELKQINLKDIKSHIEFDNGKVLVKPFNLHVKDIDMEVGGVHGFDQSMDYIIAMKVPRKYMGESGNALVGNLATQAANKGLPVQLGETVNLNVKMTGSISNPEMKTDLRGSAGDATRQMKEQAVNFVQAKADSARQTVRDSLSSVKKQVAADVKKELTNKLLGTKDSAATGSGKPLEDTKKKAEETIKNTFGNMLKKKKG